MYSVDLAAQRCLTTLAGRGLVVSATVRESQTALDLALLGGCKGTTVIRCVAERSERDAQVLRAMLSEGDFDRAFLVHTGDETDLTGEIQTWPLSRIDELAALLAKESLP
jgi:hypothetical protein